MKYRVYKGSYTSKNILETISSFQMIVSEGYWKFYFRGTKSLMVVQKNSIDGVLVVMIDNRLNETEKTALFDKVTSLPKFEEFVDNIPAELLGVELLVDWSTMVMITPDSFMEYYPASMENQLMMRAIEINGEEKDIWPPCIATLEDDYADVVFISALIAARRIHKPVASSSWTDEAKMLLINLVANFYVKKIDYSLASIKTLARRQKFYVPKEDKVSPNFPEDSLDRINGLRERVMEKLLKHEKKDDKPVPTQSLLPIKVEKKEKTVFLSDLLQMGADIYMKTLTEGKYDVELDWQLDPSLHIKSMVIWGGSILIDTGGEEFKANDIIEILGTANIFHATVSE